MSRFRSSKDTLGDDFRFVKENENVKVLSYKGQRFRS